MNYQKLYDDIVYNAKHRLQPNTYCENHHILPKSDYPEYKDLKKNPWNSVILTAREHFICHLLLRKIYNTPSMWLAYNAMFVSNEHMNRYKPKLFSIELTKGIVTGMYKSKKEPCKVCSKLHNKKYCCSKKCFNIYITQDGNEYTKTLSKIKKENLSKLTKEEQTKRAKNSFGSCDHEARGIAISKGKKGKKLGMKSSAARIINIYNKDDLLMFVCEGNFKHICAENNLPVIQLTNSYRNNGTPIFPQETPNIRTNKEIFKQYKGWYATYQN